jgi:hypothetical protein
MSVKETLDELEAAAAISSKGKNGDRIDSMNPVRHNLLNPFLCSDIKASPF